MLVVTFLTILRSHIVVYSFYLKWCCKKYFKDLEVIRWTVNYPVVRGISVHWSNCFVETAMQGNEYITSSLLLAALEAEAPQTADNFWSLLGADAKTCQGLLCRPEPAQACKGLLRPNNAWDGWAGPGSSEVLFSSLVSERINPSGPELLWCGASSDVSPSVAQLTCSPNSSWDPLTSTIPSAASALGQKKLLITVYACLDKFGNSAAQIRWSHGSWSCSVHYRPVPFGWLILHIKWNLVFIARRTSL